MTFLEPHFSSTDKMTRPDFPLKGWSRYFKFTVTFIIKLLTLLCPFMIQTWKLHISITCKISLLEKRIQKTGDINIQDLSSRALNINISENYMKWTKNCSRKENTMLISIGLRVITVITQVIKFGLWDLWFSYSLLGCDIT